MREWINQTLKSPAFSFAVPPAAFFLGLLSSVASAMCSLPMVGVVVGYSASRRNSDAVIFGVSLGKMTVKAKKAESAIRTIAGVLLVGVGFYFLASL